MVYLVSTNLFVDKITCCKRRTPSLHYLSHKGIFAGNLSSSMASYALHLQSLGNLEEFQRQYMFSLKLQTRSRTS